MAVVAALDAVLMLRLGRIRPGWPRAASAVLGAALVIALANWAIVSGQMGKPMGLLPWEPMVYPVPDFIWTLTHLATHQGDVAGGRATLVVTVARGTCTGKRTPGRAQTSPTQKE